MRRAWHTPFDLLEGDLGQAGARASGRHPRTAVRAAAVRRAADVAPGADLGLDARRLRRRFYRAARRAPSSGASRSNSP